MPSVQTLQIWAKGVAEAIVILVGASMVTASMDEASSVEASLVAAKMAIVLGTNLDEARLIGSKEAHRF